MDCEPVMSMIMPGAEPFFFKRGPQGVLLAHGFTATPQEVYELGNYLADEGCTVLGVRLAGHGTSLENLAQTRWLDWLHSLEDGYSMLKSHCASIVVGGLSTGGVLSLLLSTKLEVAGVIGMSTPIDLPPSRMIRILYPLLPVLAPILPPIPKGPPDWFDTQAIQNRVAYDFYDARAVYQFGQLVRTLEPLLPAVKRPLLLMHSTHDDFIPIQQMHRIYNAVGSEDKEVFTVDKSGHVISCDAQRELIFQRAAQFIHKLNRRQQVQ
ncbi:MAG: alpha/beta fold hydrolase [Anaerolineales bacterium]